MQSVKCATCRGHCSVVLWRLLSFRFIHSTHIHAANTHSGACARSSGTEGRATWLFSPVLRRAVKQQRCWTRYLGEIQRTATTNDHKPRGLQQKCILSVLKGGVWNQDVSRVDCSEALREQLARDWWLPSILGPHQSLARSCIAPVSASIFTWPSALRLFPLLSSCKDLSLDLGPLLIKGGLTYRSLISSAKTLFPNKVTLSGSGWALPLGGSQFNPGQHSYKGPRRTRLTSSRRLCEGGDTLVLEREAVCQMDMRENMTDAGATE